MLHCLKQCDDFRVSLKSGNKISCKLSTWNLIILNIEFIKTTRSKRQLLNDQYLYQKTEAEDRGNTYWERKEEYLFQQILQRATEATLAKIPKLETVPRNV